MKKALAVFAAFVMAFSLSGCVIFDKQGPTAEIPNPVHESTAEEILQTLGINMNIPDNAVDVNYFIIDITGNGQIAQAMFKTGNVNYTYRIKPSAQFEDISGAYYDWTTVNKVEVSYCSGEVRYNEGKQGVCLWYDIVPGLMYSLYMDTGASEEALLSMANELFVPAQDVGVVEGLQGLPRSSF